ncbi:MAG TPA: hypothetical protein VNS32_27000 [Flavisolibacter sp.]|nr:hypothetical protein [Flavisolibacter sp.]
MKKAYLTILLYSIAFNFSCSDKGGSSMETVKSATNFVGSIAQVPLSGTINSLIKKFKDASSLLLFEGENRGDALLSSLGNQLEVATQNAQIAFSNEMDKTFDQLNGTGQSYFTQLNLLLKGAEGTTNRAISVLEVANLNLMELNNRLPLTNKVYTYINKIVGLTQMHQSNDYKITISGLGLGQDNDDVRYSWTVKIGDKTLPLSSLSRTPPFDMTVKINRNFLENYFNDSSYSFIPLVINSSIDVKYKCGLVFNCHKTLNAKWNLKLTLLPRYPGVLTGVEILKGEALDGNTLTKSVVVTTPEACSNDAPCDWSREIKLASNERVIGVRMSCDAGLCPWSSPLRPGHGNPDYDILQGGTSVIVYRHNNAGPVTITHYVDYQTIKQFTTEKPLTPVRLQFGQPVVIPLSQENTACAYRLKGKLITGQEFYIDNSMIESNDKLFTRIGTGNGPSGLTCSPSFVLNIP